MLKLPAAVFRPVSGYPSAATSRHGAAPIPSGRENQDLDLASTLPAVSVDDSIKCARMVLEMREIERAPIALVFDDGEGSGDT